MSSPPVCILLEHCVGPPTITLFAIVLFNGRPPRLATVLEKPLKTLQRVAHEATTFMDSFFFYDCSLHYFSYKGDPPLIFVGFAFRRRQRADPLSSPAIPLLAAFPRSFPRTLDSGFSWGLLLKIMESLKLFPIYPGLGGRAATPMSGPPRQPSDLFLNFTGRNTPSFFPIPPVLPPSLQRRLSASTTFLFF